MRVETRRTGKLNPDVYLIPLPLVIYYSSIIPARLLAQGQLDLGFRLFAAWPARRGRVGEIRRTRVVGVAFGWPERPCHCTILSASCSKPLRIFSSPPNLHEDRFECEISLPLTDRGNAGKVDLEEVFVRSRLLPIRDSEHPPVHSGLHWGG